MSTPKRRSSRLRSQTPQKESFTSATPATLAVLVEREETPQGTQADIDAIASPMPGAFPVIATTPSQSRSLRTSFGNMTPPTAGPVRPDKDEMHPKHYQSTEKKLESTKRLSNVTTKIPQSSPSKQLSHPALSSFSSPTFEFRCKRPSTDMSADTQKIMDELRDQAAKIKTQLEAQRDEQAKKDADAQALYGIGGRRIATPKGRIGRFSDVHMAQFKKMDSIADHASSFRANSTKLPPAGKSLKRTNSKANLDQTDPLLKRPTTGKQSQEPKQEQFNSPAKRFKQRHEEAIASSPNQSTPTSLQRSKSGIPALTNGISSPAVGALARSNSVKSIRNTASKIPTTPTRTPSNMSPRRAKTDVGANDKFHNPFVNKLSSVKSILRKPQLRFSDDPAKLAAGTHVSPQKQKDAKAQAANDTSFKKVYFSPRPETSARSTTGSPCSTIQFSAKNKSIAETTEATAPVTYPSLYPVPSISETSYPITDSDWGISQASTPTMQQRTKTTTTTIPLAPPGSTGPGDFTFRFASPGTRAISFADPSSPITPHMGKKTIRPVSSSGTFTVGPQTAALQLTAPRASIAWLPNGSVSHGLDNKKRKRETEDNTDQGDNKENTPMENTTIKHDEDVNGGCTPKKARLTVDAASLSSRIPASTKATGMPPTKAKKPAISIPSSRAKAGKSSHSAAAISGGAPKSKGILSMSRLNALARPKERK